VSDDTIKKYDMVGRLAYDITYVCIYIISISCIASHRKKSVFIGMFENIIPFVIEE